MAVVRNAQCMKEYEDKNAVLVENNRLDGTNAIALMKDKYIYCMWYQ